MSQVLGSPSEEDKLRLAVLEGSVGATAEESVGHGQLASSPAESAGKREGGVETESEVAGKAAGRREGEQRQAAQE